VPTEFAAHGKATTRVRCESSERSWSAGAVVGQVAINQVQTHETDGQVDEEDQPPMKVAHERAADDRAQHGADQRRDGDKRHRAHQLRLGERAHQRQPARRHLH